MPRALLGFVAFNIGASILVFLYAFSFGGGFVRDPFPPEHEIRLEPVTPVPPNRDDPSYRPAPGPSPSLPPEFDRVEPAAPRWETGPDGRIRLLD